MGIVETERRLRQEAKTNPIGAAREAREIADEFYALHKEIVRRPEYRAAMDEAVAEMKARG